MGNIKIIRDYFKEKITRGKEEMEDEIFH